MCLERCHVVYTRRKTRFLRSSFGIAFNKPCSQLSLACRNFIRSSGSVNASIDRSRPTSCKHRGSGRSPLRDPTTWPTIPDQLLSISVTIDWNINDKKIDIIYLCIKEKIKIFIKYHTVGECFLRAKAYTEMMGMSPCFIPN